MPGFEPSINRLRGELSTAELPDLLINGHQSSVFIKYQIVCLHINYVYAIVTK